MKLIIFIILAIVAGGVFWAYNSLKTPAIDTSIQPPTTPIIQITRQQEPAATTHPEPIDTLDTSAQAVVKSVQTETPTAEADQLLTVQAISPEPSDEEEIISMFASCNGEYEGPDYEFRATAAKLALDEERQTLTQIKMLVNQYCEGSLMVTNENVDRIVAEKSKSEISPPTATLYPTPTAKAAPEFRTDNLVAWDGRFNQEELERLIHREINNYRISQDLDPLEWVNELAMAARAHSLNMAKNDYLDHIDHNNRTPSERVQFAGYDCYVGENIFLGYGHGKTWWQGPVLIRYEWLSQEEFAALVVREWIDSPGHHRNIIRSSYTETGIGVGFGESDGIPHAIWVTQKFC